MMKGVNMLSFENGRTSLQRSREACTHEKREREPLFLVIPDFFVGNPSFSLFPTLAIGNPGCLSFGWIPSDYLRG